MMLAVSIFLARLMGPRQYGVYASAVAAVTLIGIPASLGLPNLIVREIAKYQARGEWGLMKGLLLRANQAALSVIVLIALILLVLQTQLEVREGFTAPLIWTAFALLPLTLFGALRMATLRGLHYVVLGLIPESLVMPLAFLFCIGLTHWFVPDALGAQAALALRLIAVGLAFSVGTLYLLARLPRTLRGVCADYQMRPWIRTAVPLMWVGSMSVITTQTDVLMLVALKGPEDAGVYQIAARGAELVAFVYAVSGIALQPTLARLYVQGDMIKLRQVARTAARIMFGAAFLGAVIFIVAGSDLLVTIFGEAYVGGAVALGILSGGWALIAFFGPARDTLIMTGGERAAAVSISVAAILNIVLNLLLIPRFGMSGAAFATTLSLVSCHAGYALAVRHRLGYWTSVL